MIPPVIVLAIPIMIAFGEAFLLLALPLFIGITFTAKLSKILNRSEAISYPFIQYAFFPLLFYAYPSFGI